MFFKNIFHGRVTDNIEIFPAFFLQDCYSFLLTSATVDFSSRGSVGWVQKSALWGLTESHVAGEILT